MIHLKDVIQLGGTKLKQAKSRIMNRPSKSKGKSYDKFFIYLPAGVVKDSAFPFKENQEINVRIDNGRLIIESVSES